MVLSGKEMGQVESALMLDGSCVMDLVGDNLV